MRVLHFEDPDEHRASDLAARRAAAEAELALGPAPDDPDTPVPELADRAKFWGSDLIAYASRYGIPEPVYLPILGQSGFLRKGYSHILAAAPKMGKTELVLQSMGDWVDSEQVAYFTEEYPDIWLERLTSVRGSFPDWLYEHVMFLSLPKFPHDKRVSAIMTMIEDPLFTVVVVDTIRSGLELEDENNNGLLRQALEPFTKKAHEYGKTLLLIHHTNKAQALSGSQTSVAGGLDLQGAMDAVLVLAPVDRKQNTDEDTRRGLRGWGRMRFGGTLRYSWPNKQGPLAVYQESLGVYVPPTITSEGVMTKDTGLSIRQLKALRDAGGIISVDKNTGENITGDAHGRTLLWIRVASDGSDGAGSEFNFEEEFPDG